MRRRGVRGNGLDAWPGYVDALSTLLMVIIFVLLVFVLAQAFLSVALNGRQSALDRLTREMAQLTQLLSLEKGHSQSLEYSVATLKSQHIRDEVSAATLAAELNADTAKLASADKLSTDSQAQVALLNQQLAELQKQLAAISQALDISQADIKDRDAKITDLGNKLNLALADKVEQLKRYRSEFFGRLSQLLAHQPGIRVVGDRFVFQSEVLFPPGSAELSAAGRAQMNTLARTLKTIAAEIPPDLPWILRVDGHADRQPIANTAFATNWELSSARAITVVKLLTADGINPQNLAATGFSQFQPLDNGSTPEAYARNRRIELRLTDR
ncbi:peptidoglycan -binding protein [Lichenicola sp.]|uniref:peptidoglycan -binding protein n=1 Tax=Lichenicola sp. TaxID=2804529 RepID=UPI003B00AE1F